MKELSIEQKAKRYDEALKLAKDSYNYPSYPGFIRADVVFPELKEESEDERIRKAIMEHFADSHSSIYPYKGFTKKQILDWLEKQNSNVDNANKEYWRGYREGKQEILDKYAELEKQGGEKPAEWK